MHTNLLDKFRDYFKQAHATQQYKFERTITEDEYDWIVKDPLIRNIPIYDVVNRRYAAFSSFPEAIRYGNKDPKGNGHYYNGNTVTTDGFVIMCYLFRLCGSGINYTPKIGNDPKGSHGFGNFWIDKLIRQGYNMPESWFRMIPENKFCDVKGYLLPMIKGGLRGFILAHSEALVMHIWNTILENTTKIEIHEIVNIGNEWLLRNGFNRQNFVLCAFAMDLAEYFPNIVNKESKVLVGSNAKKCLKQIFPDTKGIGTNLEATNDALKYLCHATGDHNLLYDMEDVACDFIRYINNYQSPQHIEFNGGMKYTNQWTNS